MGEECFSRDFIPKIPSGTLISTWISCCCPEEDASSCTCCIPYLMPALSRVEQISHMKRGLLGGTGFQKLLTALLRESGIWIKATDPSAGALQKPWCCMHQIWTRKPVHLLWRHKWPWDMLADNALCERSHSKIRAVAAHSSISVSPQ